MTKLVSQMSKEVELTDIDQKAASKGQISQTIVDTQATNSPQAEAARFISLVVDEATSPKDSQQKDSWPRPLRTSLNGIAVKQIQRVATDQVHGQSLERATKKLGELAISGRTYREKPTVTQHKTNTRTTTNQHETDKKSTEKRHATNEELTNN